MRSKLRCRPWPRSAITANTLRPICMTAYAQPTASPRDANAPGRAADITRLAPVRPSSSSRTAIRSGFSQLVTHVV